MNDLVIVVPLWRRTTNIDRVYYSARLATPGARVLFVASAGDIAVLDALKSDGYLDDTHIVEGPGGTQGDYAKKINAGYRWSTEPHILTGADDLLFHDGWYEAARALMTDGVGVVGTVDRCNPRTAKGVHSTHSLVARWYADQGASIDATGQIYHEGYWHEFCDDELIRTAQARGAYAHAFDATVEHVHMLKDRTLDDETYRQGRAKTVLSRRLFMRRSRLWGGRHGPRQYRRVTR